MALEEAMPSRRKAGEGDGDLLAALLEVSGEHIAFVIDCRRGGFDFASPRLSELHQTTPERLTAVLVAFGGAPLFFYLVHIYSLNLLNLGALAVLGPNHGEAFSVPNVASIWLLAAVVAVPVTRWPSGFAAICRWSST